MASPKKMVRATSPNLLADDAFEMVTAENFSVSQKDDTDSAVDVTATTQPARLFSPEFMDYHQTATAPSASTYNILVVGLVSFSVAGGYLAGTQPNGEWRFFSWHPLLMTIGMVGLMGIGAITKKLGGYTNTKVNGKQRQHSLSRVHCRHGFQATDPCTFLTNNVCLFLRILLPVVARNDWLGSYPNSIGRYLLHLQEQGNVWKKSRTYSHPRNTTRPFVSLLLKLDYLSHTLIRTPLWTAHDASRLVWCWCHGELCWTGPGRRYVDKTCGTRLAIAILIFALALATRALHAHVTMYPFCFWCRNLSTPRLWRGQDQPTHSQGAQDCESTRLGDWVGHGHWWSFAIDQRRQNLGSVFCTVVGVDSVYSRVKDSWCQHSIVLVRYCTATKSRLGNVALRAMGTNVYVSMTVACRYRYRNPCLIGAQH
jgi:hypothetical protein